MQILSKKIVFLFSSTMQEKGPTGGLELPPGEGAPYPGMSESHPRGSEVVDDQREKTATWLRLNERERGAAAHAEDVTPPPGFEQNPAGTLNLDKIPPNMGGYAPLGDDINPEDIGLD